MPSVASVGDPFVFLQKDEYKPPQPTFLVDWDQGPVGVDDRSNYPDPGFNPQEIVPVGPDGHDAYPANPVIAWHNWTYRDPSQSMKVPNTGATNIVPRALLDQQLGRQAPPIIYPNMVMQSPADWDDPIMIAPEDAVVQVNYVAAAQQYQPLQVNIVS